MKDKNIIQNFINNIPTGILCIDKEFNIVFWNKELSNILGFDEKELLYKSINNIELYEKKNKETLLEMEKCLKKNKMQNIVYILTKENEFRQVYINAKILIEDELFAVISITDYSIIESCRIDEEHNENEYTFHNLVGKDKKMTEIYRKIEMAGESLANVLIYGESGTGKELIAKAIHELSDRKNNSFVVVNCSALSESLLESELFGHVKGSFTGAYKDKTGKFELAHSGTIFLDEIGEVSPLIQLKLLRVIQEKTIQRVGDNHDIKVDMRIISATNRNLRQLVNEGKFREDLFYRLNVFPVNTIPLRERKNDIPILAKHFIEKFNDKTGKKIQGFTDDSARLIMDYCWPGNVRELENCIEHAFVVCNNDRIDIFDLPQELRIVSIKQGICKDLIENMDQIKSSVKTPVIQKKQMSKEELIEILNKNKWNKTLTAEELGITRVALWKRMKKFGL